VKRTTEFDDARFRRAKDRPQVDARLDEDVGDVRTEWTSSVEDRRKLAEFLSDSLSRAEVADERGEDDGDDW
jgi:hypothetical protein